ncbi:hypothetical protein LCGC14_1448380 [marine sediment metagenome]|uniref:Uncharacterized protein n=1 Tax=marine sediment metagenome TaxID=412755 RepID=A0A0F9MKF6_9ZZZZ
MILKILAVKPGAYDQFEEEILDFWIIGQLASKKKIKIFDYNYDLRGFIGKKVECLIFTPLASISKQTRGKPGKNVVKVILLKIIRSTKNGKRFIIKNITSMI